MISEIGLKPDGQWQFGGLKYRTRCHRGMVMAVVTLLNFCISVNSLSVRSWTGFALKLPARTATCLDGSIMSVETAFYHYALGWLISGYKGQWPHGKGGFGVISKFRQKLIGVLMHFTREILLILRVIQIKRRVFFQVRHGFRCNAWGHWLLALSFQIHFGILPKIPRRVFLQWFYQRL